MQSGSLAALKHRGIVIIKSTEGIRPKVEKNADAFKAFCELPDKIKRQFEYSGDVLLSGVGYKPFGSSSDPHKEHFHARLNAREWLMEQSTKIDNEIVTTYVCSCLDLLEGLRDLTTKMAVEAEEEFGSPNLAHDINACMESHTLRSVHYDGDFEINDVIAATHLDKGGATLTLFESVPGFQILNSDGSWQDVVFSADEIAVIAGFRMQHRTECRVKAIYHKVVATMEAVGVGRYSTLLFVDFLNGAYYDKLGRKKSMQDYPDNFFSDMSFEELDTYCRRA